jgi:hypothetical protein
MPFCGIELRYISKSHVSDQSNCTNKPSHALSEMVIHCTLSHMILLIKNDRGNSYSGHSSTTTTTRRKSRTTPVPRPIPPPTGRLGKFQPPRQPPLTDYPAERPRGHPSNDAEATSQRPATRHARQRGWRNDDDVVTRTGATRRMWTGTRTADTREVAMAVGTGHGGAYSATISPAGTYLTYFYIDYLVTSAPVKHEDPQDNEGRAEEHKTHTRGPRQRQCTVSRKRKPRPRGTHDGNGNGNGDDDERAAADAEDGHHLPLSPLHLLPFLPLHPFVPIFYCSSFLMYLTCI